MIEADSEIGIIIQTRIGCRSIKVHGVLTIREAQAAQRLHFIPANAIVADRHSIKIRPVYEWRRRRPVRFITKALGPETQDGIRLATDVHAERQLIARVNSTRRVVEGRMKKSVIRSVGASHLRAKSARAGEQPMPFEAAGLESIIKGQLRDAIDTQFNEARLSNVRAPVGKNQ